MSHTIGTCSICGGPVQEPTSGADQTRRHRHALAAEQQSATHKAHKNEE